MLTRVTKEEAEALTAGVEPRVIADYERTMDFCEAMRAVIQGHRVTKLEWDDLRYWGELRDDVLWLHKADGKYYWWIISHRDLLGTDYKIVAWGGDRKLKATPEQIKYIRENHEKYKKKWQAINHEYKQWKKTKSSHKNFSAWKEQVIKSYSGTDDDLLDRLAGKIPLHIEDGYASNPSHIAVEDLARHAGCEKDALTYQDVMRYKRKETPSNSY